MENNKIYRNLQEQVLFNSQELKALKQFQANGLEIAGLVETESDLPAIVNGENYLVGTVKPYQLYVAIGGSYYNLGNFPAPGPVGDRGIQGEGLQGERGTEWTVGTLLPSSAKVGDLHINYEGKIWKYDGAQWQYALSIKGPQGLLGRTGERGERGEKGERGESGPQGTAAPAVVIKGVLNSISQLPDPTIEPRNSAYLIGANLYVIVGESNLSWKNLGNLFELATADQILFDDSLVDYQASYVDAALNQEAHLRGRLGKIENGLKNLIDPSKDGYQDEKYLNNASGGVGTYSELCISNYIPLEDSLIFYAFSNNRSDLTKHYAVYDANKTFIRGGVGSNDGSYFKYDIGSKSSGETYIRFNLRKGYDLAFDSKNMDSNEEIYNIYETDKIEKDYRFKDNAISFRETDFVKEKGSRNLLYATIENSPDFVNHLIHPTDGYLMTGSAYMMSELIPVKRNTYYIFPKFQYIFPKPVFYDINGNFIQATRIREIVITELEDGETVKFIFNDPLVGYVRINGYQPLWNLKSYLMEGETYPAEGHDSYDRYLEIEGLRVKGVNPNTEKNPLWGKKLGIEGDSIAAPATSYGPKIALKNNMNIQKIAVSGGTLRTGTSSVHQIATSLSGLDANCDYILVEGGINDYNNDRTVPGVLGTITNNYDGPYDTTTISGAMETICKKLSEDYEDSKVGFVFIHNYPAYNSEWYNTWKPHMKEVLRKWGIPWVDIGEASPSFVRNDTMKDKYTTGDRLHPNELGYERYYNDVIENFLKTL